MTVPQDRRPPRKAAVRKPTPAEMAYAEEDRGDSPDALDRVEAEAASLDVDWLTVPLGGEPVRVMPIHDWPRWVYTALTQRGDLDAVAEVIHPDDVDLYEDPDLTFGAVNEWVNEAVAAAGQSVGESRASRRSSRGMRRR